MRKFNRDNTTKKSTKQKAKDKPKAKDIFEANNNQEGSSSLQDLTSAETQIELLNKEVGRLNLIIQQLTEKDTAYKHSKPFKYQQLGRTRDQLDALDIIANHLFRTCKRPSQALEKIESYPIKVRDKLILTMSVYDAFIKTTL